MRILWVATKPPWPPRDGGRVVTVNTLRALRADGHECVVVSPLDGADRSALTAALRDVCEPHLVDARPRSLAASMLLAGTHGLPVTIVRHAVAAVTKAVERLLADRPFDVVHAEQLQALAQCEPARRRSVPIVLRAQNVESDLWSALASSGPLLRPLARLESARLARYEGIAMRRVAAAIALTARDAERLRSLSGRSDGIHHVAAPFPPSLPVATARLSGEPAVVILAGGWLPNRDGAGWFCRSVWPEVLAQCPRAMLHVFGAVPGVRPAPAVTIHEPPDDSRDAFGADAILAVPLRIASGVRVKILEAWARGVPVVATPDAAAGLDATADKELLIARDAREFAAAIRRLHDDSSLARGAVEAGRARLTARHDPARIAGELARIYREVAHPSR